MAPLHLLVVAVREHNTNFIVYIYTRKHEPRYLDRYINLGELLELIIVRTAI